MASYSNIISTDKTSNYNLIFMGDDYQTSEVIHNVNLERLCILTNAIVKNSLIQPASGEVTIPQMDIITKNKYLEKDIEDEKDERKIYFIKGAL